MTHVLLCDDEEQHIEDFILELGGTYSRPSDSHRTLFEFDDFKVEVCRTLDLLNSRLRQSANLPDILVLDLYWAAYKGKERSSFDEAVKCFNDAVDRLKQEVPFYMLDSGYTFYQHEMKRMRISDGDLPVLFYTKAGQYVLDSSKRNAIAESSAQFLLKRDPPDTKKFIIREMVDRLKFRSDLFISHCETEQNVAADIKHDLEKNYGLHVVWSPQIVTGDEFNDEIRDQIYFSKAFCVLLSKRALTRKWIMWEIGAAWALQKKLIVGLVGIDQKSLPPFISARFQCMRIDAIADRQNYINHIVMQCKHVCVDYEQMRLRQLR